MYLEFDLESILVCLPSRIGRRSYDGGHDGVNDG
jgi:hypothetical protein